jgi:large subunit ribosomal protein L9
MDIQVILTQSDPKLGQKGDVVKVSPGFAYNYLIPRGIAKPATDAGLKAAQEEKVRFAKKNEEDKARVEDLSKKISGLTVTVEVSTGENDKLYGSVTSQDVQDALSREGLRVQKSQIHLEEPIRKLGNFEINVKLHPEVSAKLKLSVVKKK